MVFLREPLEHVAVIIRKLEIAERYLLGWQLHHGSVIGASLASIEDPWFESWW